MTTTLQHTQVNQIKLVQAEKAWQQVLNDTLQRGFHGTAMLEVSVQHGTIQYIRRRIEQLEK